MKIFISYSRSDASDLAKRIYDHLMKDYEVFTDVNNIRVGDVWSNTLENNISNCDIFVVIITHGSLKSPNVEKEVLRAQLDKKRIIPCVHRNVTLRSVGYTNSKWGLEKIQGIEFDNGYDLARDLYFKIEQYQNGDGKK